MPNGCEKTVVAFNNNSEIKANATTGRFLFRPIVTLPSKSFCENIPLIPTPPEGQMSEIRLGKGDFRGISLSLGWHKIERCQGICLDDGYLEKVEA